MNIETKLHEEIEACFDRMADSANPNSDEYKANADAVTKLLDRVIEMEKIDKDAEIKEKQMIEDRKSLFTKTGVDIGTVVLSTITTVGGMLVVLTFEEKGTISSGFGKKVIDWVARKK